jgi:mono/diheme cytochrome c family protein
MRLRRSLLTFAFLAMPGVLLYSAALPQTHAARRGNAGHAPAQTVFTQQIVPMIKRYCSACHSGSAPAAGLALTDFTDLAAVRKSPDVWAKVAQNLQSAHMPPSSATQPTQAERDLVIHWVQTTLVSNIAAAAVPQNHEHVTLRRLNRAEYNNTIRDLLGVTFQPADDFPSDDVGYGFDNIGEVLALSPLLMEKYLTAADKIVHAAIIAPEDAARPEHFNAADMHTPASNGQPEGKGYLLASEGSVYQDVSFPKDGEYVLRANAYGQQAGTEPARMAFSLDNQLLNTVDVTAVESTPQTYEMRVRVTAGQHRVALAFTNDYYNPNDPNPNNRDRNLIINYLEVVGPPSLPNTLPLMQQRLLALHPTEARRDVCTRQFLADFARRAYRRPVTKVEVDRLVRCAQLAKQEGESFERGIQLGIEAALVSPNFLFRSEAPAKTSRPGASRLLNDYELASRLSYFLWSSMPDEELFALAKKGSLQNPKVLAAQVKRMLKDPKAHALAENFAGQWLQLRNLTNVAPDPARFPDFNDTLRTAMRTETEMFFEAIVSEDRSVLDFLGARFTYLNEPLARHYGIPGVTGDQFRRVTLAGDERGGILGQASILTVTSNPTRTSPVKRGKWVMEQLLGTPLPPPLPGVGQLPDDKKGPLVGTLRQRMEQHRKNPICASCHARMDPIGFGLENYDAVGAWRTQDGGQPIDASGTLPDGKSFRGPAQLKTILLSKKTLFVHCLTDKLLIYSLGRGLDPADERAATTILQQTAKQNYRFGDLVTAIVQSDPFRMRKGKGA